MDFFLRGFHSAFFVSAWMLSAWILLCGFCCVDSCAYLVSESEGVGVLWNQGSALDNYVCVRLVTCVLVIQLSCFRQCVPRSCAEFVPSSCQTCDPGPDATAPGLASCRHPLQCQCSMPTAAGAICFFLALQNSSAISRKCCLRQMAPAAGR